MDIIDFHTHIYPEKIAQKATDSTCSFYQLETELTGNSSTLLDEGRKAGISKFVLLPVVVKAEQTHSINEFIIKNVSEHSEFYGFGAMHIMTPDPFDEIEFIKKSGLKGIKLHPDIQGFAIDDSRLYPIFDYLQGKLPILVHCGDPRYDYSHPRRLRKVIDNFPHLQIIAAHLGGWSVFDDALECLGNADCFVDMSSCFNVIPPESIQKYIRAYGADRVVFGTDFPLWKPKEVVEDFMKLDLTDEEKEKIAFRNALCILENKHNGDLIL